MPLQPPGSPGSGEPAVLATDLSLAGRRAGKVRDVYELPGQAGSPPRLLIVATDRISAFDVVMPTPIPGKGRLLTELAVFWLKFIEERGICKTHLISTDEGQVPASAFQGHVTRQDLAGRTTVARRCRVVPIECVVRGYMEGSGWKEYQQTQSICGVPLPAGLRQCDKLPEPIFTPATKEEGGKHDENISFDRACELAGRPLMESLRDKSLEIYRAASQHAQDRGVIIADTKFEFGIPINGEEKAQPILIDEALTPDSSRFWPADGYQPGRAQSSYDKQYLREYLQSLVDGGKWNKQSPGPTLPERIVDATRAKYAQARDLLVS
ncbi:MAG: phosphoribosylaminoimidazolesuccinocarboxamide synthase [Phycisphaerales bacterium]|nr:phosphoribosylaminoimidazolesuccinocarboxamide synthase [Phycisphaerales bacterium]